MKPILAPMHKFTTYSFREMIQKHKGVTIAPLISARSIEHLKIRLLKKEGLQLFGIKPENFEKAANFLIKKFPNLKWVDINAGCPSWQVMQIGGAKLLYKPRITKKIIKTLKNFFEIVSIKIRIPPNLSYINYLQDADFITVHGRTVEQGYSGNADWEMIRKIKNLSSIPIIGNGDITSIKEGYEKIRQGYADGFMIGRAALKNPYIFEGKEMNINLIKKVFFEYLHILEKNNELELHDLKLKSIHFISNIKNAARLRKEISTSKTIDKIVDIFNNL